MDIQELLLAKAIRDSQSGPTMAEAASAGALAGTTLGTIGGLTSGKPFRHGRRFATSVLTGALLGGGLGAGTKAMFLSGMPNKAADMLSKIQTSPEGLSEADQLQLRAILREVYSGQ